MSDPILSQLEEIFKDVLDQPQLSIHSKTTAQDVEGWDSLAHIQLLLAIEKGFQVKFKSQEVLALQNVGEMVELLKKYKS